MVWEGRIVSAGDWVECKLSVAPAASDDFSWVGQIKLRSEEWLDFADKMKLVEVSPTLWISDEEPGLAASSGTVSSTGN